jgi:hypothetical protein
MEIGVSRARSPTRKHDATFPPWGPRGIAQPRRATVRRRGQRYLMPGTLSSSVKAVLRQGFRNCHARGPNAIRPARGRTSAGLESGPPNAEELG